MLNRLCKMLAPESHTSRTPESQAESPVIA
jgi:hypothetical protein